MDYLFLGEDSDGVSFFEDRSFDLEIKEFAPPAPALYLSGAMAASTCLFLTLPVGWGGPKHPSPCAQIGLCLSGRGRITAGSNEVRDIRPGMIWWMADTTGSGHTTEVVGQEPVHMAIVQLP